MKALGAYIFAGGFTAGIRAAGFNVVGHLEDGTYGVDTARLNFPDLPITTQYEDWPAVLKKHKKLDLIYGNPPCAAWSALNGKKTTTGTWKTDARVSCTENHFELLEEARPKVWIWESVDRAFSTGREFVDNLTERAVDAGYAVTHLRFDAQYIGGAHRRVRYFMIAHKVAFNWESWVKFSDAPQAGKVLAKASKKKADKEAFPIHPSTVKAYHAAAPGESIRTAWDRINPPNKRKIREASTGKKFVVGRPGFMYRRLDPNKVSPTVVGLNTIHPDEPRHLSIGEMKALCGYPKSWVLQDHPPGADRWNLFTRAVMPPVGEWIGTLVYRALSEGKRAKKGRVQVVDLRRRKVEIEEIAL